MPPSLLVPKKELVLRERLEIRAAFQPETFRLADGGNATVQIVASAGAAVRRLGFFDGGLEEFDELLSFATGAHRDERLNSGRVNLLLDHDLSDVRQVFGILSDPVWQRDVRRLTLTARLSRRDEHRGLVQDVRDGILVNTSIGYRTFQVRDVTKKGDPRRQLEAIDWETREVSIISVGADAGAHVRHLPEDEEPGRTTIVILSRSQEEPMPPTDPNQPNAPTTPNQPSGLTTTEERAAAEARAATQRAATPAPATVPAAAQPVVPTAAGQPATSDERGADGERDRQRSIRERLRAARLPNDDPFATGMLDDRRVSPDAASSRILERMSGSPDAPPIDGLARVGGEEGATLTRAVEDALLFRARQEEFIDGIRDERGAVSPAKLRARLQGNPFVHRSLLEVGEEFVANVFNVRTLARMPKLERAGAILRPRIQDEQRSVGSIGLGHSTSDFPGILANIVSKILRGRFELAPNTWAQWTSRGSLADYKQATRVQLGASPRLLQVREGAEYIYGTIGEQSEPIILAKWGRIVSLTREAMINDDLNAFARISGQYGASAMQLIADLVYAHLTGNTVMADGLAIFHATHKNLVTGAGNGLAAAGIASLSNLRTKARLQTSIDPGLAGPENTAFFMGVAIEHLRVPAELETAAQQLTSLIQPALVGSVNPFQGIFRSVMAEPRLSASSALAYYGMSDPSMQDTIEVAFLQGEDGPMVETRQGFERDGVDIKVRMDVGTAPTDFRGLYKNEGTV